MKSVCVRDEEIGGKVGIGWLFKNKKKLIPANEIFPLSNHADFNERIEYIKKSNPEIVITCHRYFYKEFAEWIRNNLGIKAFPIPISGQKKLAEFFPSDCKGRSGSFSLLFKLLIL